MLPILRPLPGARHLASRIPTLLVLGVGGLGCPATLALAEDAAQRGRRLRLVLVDPDRVERSNLARQILYGEADLGSPKVEVAARRLAAVSGGMLELAPLCARFDAGSAALVDEADAVLDGTDSFEARFAANDLCVLRRRPLVHGAVLGWEGQLLTVLPGETACLRCLFEGPPPGGAHPTCAEAGVAAPLCGLVGAAMAQAALDLLDGRPRAGLLERWDGVRGTARPLSLRRDPECACARSAA